MDKVPAHLFERSVVCPIVVGRTKILATLDRLRDQARSGSGQIALLSGEAGIGKSRLVTETKNQAAARDMLVLQGNCFEHDSALPYAPLLDLIRGFCATHSPDEVSRYLGPTASDLVKVLPELATLLPDLAPSAALEPEQEKRRLFEAFVQFLFRLAALHPLLIVVEDVHWSDGTSLEFWLHFSLRLASQPALLLLTFRRDVARKERRIR